MSDLDLEIINHVPPGGNWKNVPDSVPSKRIQQIKESYKNGGGSRSTYYGRLLRDKPSYTINTYFNRPGNGCHIHYEQNRTLSQREAARLQSFPDDFVFEGSKTAIYNQIGNAVPPLLSFQIACAIPFKGMFLDLFSGAGGLALGFTWAGWQQIAANDINKDALATHAKNLNSDIVLGDITEISIFESVVSAVEKARKDNPDKPIFILGGPPCQGFSTANRKRDTIDQRNWLFKSYIELLKSIEPDGFIFENVKGILNLDKGNFFEMILGEMKECVEEVKVNICNSVNFGIPQRRERVIIIGGNKKLIDAFRLEEITELKKDDFSLSFLNTAISVEEAISDLPPIEPAEDGSEKEYLYDPQTEYQKFVRGIITPDEYISYLTDSAIN